MINEFYHYGVRGKSGRYPWGSGGRPYQRLEQPKKQGSSITEYIRKRKREKEEAKAAASATEKAKAEQDEARAKEEFIRKKEEALRVGSASDILKFKGSLTNQEMQNAVTRLNLESQLSSLSSRETNAVVKEVDQIMKGVKMGTEWVNTGMNAYNTLAKIYNSTEGGKNKPLTIIGEGKKKEKDKKN